MIRHAGTVARWAGELLKRSALLLADCADALEEVRARREPCAGRKTRRGDHGRRVRGSRFCGNCEAILRGEVRA